MRGRGRGENKDAERWGGGMELVGSLLRVMEEEAREVERCPLGFFSMDLGFTAAPLD
jgi:hypothetical protein